MKLLLKIAFLGTYYNGYQVQSNVPTVQQKMNEAAKHFCGEHYFDSYMAQGSKIVDTRRCVKYAEVTKEGDTVIFKVAADGFLYNMVRIMCGTLLLVASGKISPEEIDAITDSRDRSRAGMTVPPQGLYLNKVEY